MNRVFFVFLIILHSQVIFAQFTDDFSDGDFTDSPSWIGDSSKFEADSTNKLHTNLGTLIGEVSLVTQLEESLQLNTGMYIVWMKVFSNNGNAERFKEVIVLSR